MPAAVERFTVTLANENATQALAMQVAAVDVVRLASGVDLVAADASDLLGLMWVDRRRPSGGRGVPHDYGDRSGTPSPKRSAGGHFAEQSGAVPSLGPHRGG